MNKNELVAVVADGARITKKDADVLVDLVVESIIGALKEGEEVKIPGLGIFGVKVRSARKGINPSTKEKIDIPASKVVFYKAAKTLKELVK